MNRNEFITIINKAIELIDHEVWEDSYINGKEEDYETYLNNFIIFINDAKLIINKQLFNKYLY